MGTADGFAEGARNGAELQSSPDFWETILANCGNMTLFLRVGSGSPETMALRHGRVEGIVREPC
jgi:hypothetical protein